MLSIDAVSVDAEFKSLLPPLTDDERADLKAQFLADGVFHAPIIVWLHKGLIIDGHNRYEIWVECGSDPMTAPDILEKKFDSRDDVKRWMARNALARRNLTPAQRVQVALLVRDEIKESVKAGRRPASNCDEFIGTRSGARKRAVNEQVAEIAGVSRQTVDRTIHVMENGDSATKNGLMNGTLSANAAYQKVKAASVPSAETVQLKVEASVRKLCTYVEATDQMLAQAVCAIDELLRNNHISKADHQTLLAHHSVLFKHCSGAMAAAREFRKSWEKRGHDAG